MAAELGLPASAPVPWLFVTRVPEGETEPNCCPRFVGVTERFWFDARERACVLLQVAPEHLEWMRLDGMT